MIVVFLTEEEKLAERAAWDKGLAALRSCGFQSDDDQTRWIEDAQEVQRVSRQALSLTLYAY